VPERSSRRHQRYDNILTLGDGWDEGRAGGWIGDQELLRDNCHAGIEGFGIMELQGQMLMDLIQ
jgi:hypothetical protein